MLGTQLGIPGLACFLAYVGLCFKGNVEGKMKNGERHLTPALSPSLADSRRGEGEAGESVLRVEAMPPVTCHLSQLPSSVPRPSSLQAACRAGALAMLVAFWFDGGLFHLPTAAVFWILLELGAYRGSAK